ncbi:MAG: hypothetical protein DMG25_16720 [Acidobacteria bacterium]|nr:MAG: hypothetical protein DMG25_16720 [Acidobacteriota bacterium]PYV23652.1 MAG: hypothetical protein DMG27_15120 [Acidobacteriota bacterium]
MGGGLRLGDYSAAVTVDHARSWQIGRDARAPTREDNMVYSTRKSGLALAAGAAPASTST